MRVKVSDLSFKKIMKIKFSEVNTRIPLANRQLGPR